MISIAADIQKTNHDTWVVWWCRHTLSPSLSLADLYTDIWVTSLRAYNQEAIIEQLKSVAKREGFFSEMSSKLSFKKFWYSFWVFHYFQWSSLTFGEFHSPRRHSWFQGYPVDHSLDMLFLAIHLPRETILGLWAAQIPFISRIKWWIH